MLSFDGDNEDENLFINGKLAVKIRSKADSSFSIKDRPQSSTANKELKIANNTNSNSSLNLRLTTTNSIRKSQKSTNDTQSLKTRPRTATNRFFTNL